MSSKHNKLEAAIVEEFGSRFAPGTKLIFLRGAPKKPFLFNKVAFTKLGIPISEYESFPDLVLYDSKKKWLFLIEAATGNDLISPQRHSELIKMFKKCKAGKVYVTAFWDFASYNKHANAIAWETEVWIAEMPSRMIHYNGDTFLGPR